ncbi:glycosyltransferase [Cohnella fermenti]|uniref:glycosyltransferase n=1 Tax=Cohnella fermenti TaxID=2565925 RepID=UPI001E35EF3A|nr:glycosyltransferase family 2 protein [Cohnella fermenti]
MAGARDAGVSVVVCTNRPAYLGNIIDNYSRQHYRKKELILIVNDDSADLAMYRRVASRAGRASVYRMPSRISLGQCLNAGMGLAKLPLIAKFDDDDYYSPNYLKEQVGALMRKKADVVGKHSCLVYLEASRRLLLRSKEYRNKYATFVQGGTILFRREVLKQVRFPDLSVGEDVKFLRDCSRRGYRTYATSPYNYVYIRRANKMSHTWRVKDEFYRRGSEVIGSGAHYRAFADR